MSVGCKKVHFLWVVLQAKPSKKLRTTRGFKSELHAQTWSLRLGDIEVQHIVWKPIPVVRVDVNKAPKEKRGEDHVSLNH